MKKIIYFSAAAMMAVLSLSSCKKDKKDDNNNNNNNNTTAPMATATMNDSNHGNTSTSINVSGASSATIRLDVSSTTHHIDKIYIMKSEDNGNFTSSVFANLTSTANLNFTGGSNSYSFDAPDSAKSFILDIPVTLRSNATTDVYYVWMTQGDGDFTMPTKHQVLGMAKITLHYTSSTAASFTSATTTIGDQTSNSGFMLSLVADISALLQASYSDAPESCDLSAVALNAAGTAKEDGSNYIYLVSPDIRDDLGFTGEPSGANTSYISAYAGSDFETITGAQLQNLTVGASQKVQIAVGGVYQFATESGRKGLIKINSISHEIDVDGGVNINATIKETN